MENKIIGRVFCGLNRPNRWLGIIDYPSLIFVIAYIFALFGITTLFGCQILTKTMITVVFTIPIICIITANINEESVIYMIYIVIKYICSTKLYLYKIE